MLMDSVTVLLHRLGVAYVALMNPVLRVRRDADGELLDVQPQPAGADDGATASTSPGSTSSCRRRSTASALAEAQRLLPMVVADARQVAVDSRGAVSDRAADLAHELDADTGARFPGPDRQDVAESAALAGRRALRAAGLPAVRGRRRHTPTVDETSRLGVARLRTEVLPELTEPGDLLVLAQATMPSFLRYGAYPYIVVVRESSRGGQDEADRSSTGSSGCSPSRR